jgi:hypothetical protein
MLEPGVPAGDVYHRDLCLCQGHRSQFLTVIPAGFLYVTLAAWGVTFIGMMRELASLFAPRAKRNNPAVLSDARHEREMR